jgi:hypothetical protein
MLNSILDKPGIHINTYLNIVIPLLVPKLTEENVFIRSTTVSILKKMYRVIRKTTFIKNLLVYL